MSPLTRSLLALACAALLHASSADPDTDPESFPSVDLDLGLGESYSADPGYKYIQELDAWLRLHIVPATWSDARLRCHLEGGILLSPSTAALTAAMKKIMYDQGLVQSRVYTGIHALFSKGDFMTIDGIPLSNISLQWADGEPNNLGNNEDCLAMTGAGELDDVRCDSVHPYVCLKKNARMIVNECGTTAREYSLEPRTGSCYRFHREPRPWRRAAMACAADHAHLAVINSDVESQVLKELYAKNPDESIKLADSTYIAHIGFLDWNERGEWLTIFGETFAEAGFGTWDKNEPNNFGGNEYCGSVSRSGMLNDVACENVKIPFICEITP